MNKIALLDTDFISKTYSVQDNCGNHLIDCILKMPKYKFFCHAQIVIELNQNCDESPLWLQSNIASGKIKSYTDKAILESLTCIRGPYACATYTQMLRMACDAFSNNYFSEHYEALEDIDYETVSNEDYLNRLQKLDLKVGKKNNLGEIKSFVLLQVLTFMFGEEIYVFCSDDKNARSGTVSIEKVRCISLLTAFSRLKKEMKWTIFDAEPYIESLIIFYEKSCQTTFKVIEASEVKRIKRVPCKQVLQEIFEGKFIELKNGMLRYKQ